MNPYEVRIHHRSLPYDDQERYAKTTSVSRSLISFTLLSCRLGFLSEGIFSTLERLGAPHAGARKSRSHKIERSDQFCGIEIFLLRRAVLPVVRGWKIFLLRENRDDKKEE